MQNMLPLCVDLDGTLVKSDTLFESLAHLLKEKPWLFFAAPFWLLKGKAYLKSKLVQHVKIDPGNLPYSEDFMCFLQDEHAKGRKLVLITAAHENIAGPVAAHLGIFSEVIATNRMVNMKGRQKTQILDAKFGKSQYDYAGNSKADLAIWPNANAAIVVNAKPTLIQTVQRSVPVSHTFGRNEISYKTVFKAIRAHQLLKNILIFVPLFVGHLYTQFYSLKNAALAFLAFCFMAIGVYLFNDLLDLSADRHHKMKRHRPFAAGDLPLVFGFITIPVVWALAIAIGSLLPYYFLLTLLLYGGLTFVYTLYLKRLLLIDVFILAILYTLRILAGMTAIETGYSEWLLSFAIFFFLSLAFIKRFTELKNAALENKQTIAGRGYLPSDAPQVAIFGVASGYISVLVFALYINSLKVITLYQHPLWLWSVCLILLYWLTRLWMLTWRGSMIEDPVIFALKDKTSVLILLVTGLIVVSATL